MILLGAIALQQVIANNRLVTIQARRYSVELVPTTKILPMCFLFTIFLGSRCISHIAGKVEGT